VFFLVTGASGVGKSTVRKLLEPEFADVLEVAELGMLGSTPKWLIEWRHQMVERTVLSALEAQRVFAWIPLQQMNELP
jgi:broad-specificity NMP kinase